MGISISELEDNISLWWFWISSFLGKATAASSSALVKWKLSFSSINYELTLSPSSSFFVLCVLSELNFLYFFLDFPLLLFLGVYFVVLEPPANYDFFIFSRFSYFSYFSLLISIFFMVKLLFKSVMKEFWMFCSF